MTITVYSSWFQTITSLGHRGRQRTSVTDFNILSNSNCQFCVRQLKKPQKEEMQSTPHLLSLMIHCAAEWGQGGSSRLLQGICRAGSALVWKVSRETATTWLYKCSCALQVPLDGDMFSKTAFCTSVPGSSLSCSLQGEQKVLES